MEEEKRNNKKVLSIVIVLILLVVIAGASFAIWNYAFTGGENVISTDEISIEYLESTDVIAIDNALPMSDQEGKLQEETFDFEVTTRTGSNINIGYSLILDKLDVDDGYTPLNDSDIRLYLTDENDKELVQYNINAIDENYVIYSDVNSHDSTNKEIKDRYSVRIWIDEDVDASGWDMNTKQQYKFRINVESSETNNLDVSGANYPTLTGATEATVEGSSIIPIAEENIQITKSNMIPVYYDEEEGTWKKADETNTVSAYKWYDYEEKMWANSVTVTSDTRSTYQNASLGTPISMEDILTMQVWIPRYKYKIWNYNLDGTVSSNPQTIQIVFEEGKETTGQIDCEDSIQGTSDGTPTGELPTSSEICEVIETNTECTDELCNGKTYTHPAFTFGEDELSGFWVGKFENSHDGEENACTPVTYESPNTGCNVTTMNVKVIPNVSSWRGIQLGTSYTNIVKMNEGNNMYGFIENQDDTHMMKNNEWGAVAYLSHSKYGKNAELEMNTNSGYKTGCGPISAGSTIATTGCSTYETELGQGASTTGNIYGVYDMSGGAWDQVMSMIISPDGTSPIVGQNLATTGQYKYTNSGFNGIVYDSGKYTNYAEGLYALSTNTKYYDKYSYGTTNSDSNAIRRSKLGEGIKEVLNTSKTEWYNNYCQFAYSVTPLFNRGGRINFGSHVGIFSSAQYSGASSSYVASRLVISIP